MPTAPPLDETHALLKDLVDLMKEMKAASGQPSLISLLPTHSNSSDKSFTSLKEMTEVLKEMNKREALSGMLEASCPRSISNLHSLT
jgi:hypothetical protein